MDSSKSINDLLKENNENLNKIKKLEIKNKELTEQVKQIQIYANFVARLQHIFEENGRKHDTLDEMLQITYQLLQNNPISPTINTHNSKI